MPYRKTCLVTGADGFIGSHVVEHLLRAGATVRAFVCYNSFNSWGWLDTLPQPTRDTLEVVAGDVRDPHGVRAAMRDVDTVFHLAALIAIPFSYHSPDTYVDTNVKGTLNVLQAARDLGTRRVLITSTSEVYGTAQTVPITEDHPRQPQSPYSATKIAADALAESFHRCFDVPVTIVRPFNTYGPRQSARAVIPTIITQLLAGKTEIELGDLRPTRDLVYVEDTARGFVEVAACDTLVGADCNIATGTDVAIGAVARAIVDMINPHATIVQDPQRMRPAKSEVFRLCGANQRLQEHVGWTPGHTLRQGLEKTIDWFRQPGIMARYKAGIYNI